VADHPVYRARAAAFSRAFSKISMYDRAQRLHDQSCRMALT
jgi:hypothetical protein